MKVYELVEALGKLEQTSEIRITLLKDGWRTFSPMKEIKSLDPVFDQDTAELIYVIPVSISREEINFIETHKNPLEKD